MKLDTHELAWAAGFFDGEGYSGYRSESHSYRILISQNDRRVLDRFRTAVLNRGRIKGPYQYGHRKPLWYWTATSFEDCQAVIALLWAYLSPIKRQQARAALCI